MSDAADSWTKEQRLAGEGVHYNEGDYHETSNPTGFNSSGHPINLPRMAKDIGDTGKECAQYLQMLLTYLQSANGWAVEARAVTRISDTEFAVSGTVAGDDLTSVYKARRAVSLIQGVSSGFAWITGSVYEAGPNRTIVTIVPQTEGLAVDAGLTAVWFGQDPSNAPMVIIPEAPLTDPAQLEYLLW